jgi:hypothetical protein
MESKGKFHLPRITEHNIVAIHFYPHGYSADAPPLP